MDDPLADRMRKRMKGRVGIAVRRGMVVKYDDGMDGIFIMHHGAMPTRQADQPGHRQQSQRSAQKDGSDVTGRHENEHVLPDWLRQARRDLRSRRIACHEAVIWQIVPP
ncbi:MULTISPECIES: hypothetical protein [unclassified Sphingomonas]|uniref:hypothetical protein n=1 Tax=unclassified Sphingomonas TaxID=196159 RepID=UPI00286CF8B8|nr:MULTISPECIES: hypothetical protein [unclassified Sphingomonas]